MSHLFPITDPVLIFAVVAAVILLSPMLLRRYRIPGMIGLLLSGALLGPNGLGVLERDQSFVLFGAVGLLYIMFMAALEIDLAVFKRYRYHSLIFGCLTFALPQGIGFLVARYLLHFDILSAVLLASLFASHTLLSYPIASRLGISGHPSVTTAVGGTILTDTLALIVLAVVAGLHSGDVHSGFWYRLIGSLALYVTGILIILPLLGRWFFRRIERDGTTEFVFVLSVVFGTASLSHLAGVEPILGAFLAGLALNRLIPERSTLMNRIRFTGEAIFVPFFLLSVGMLVNVRVMAGGLRFWIITTAMLGSVLLTKWLAAALTRPVLGYSADAAGVLFGITVAQAAATLAATMVGHDIGLFDETVVNASIMMILGTCILAPFITEWAGTRLADQIREDAHCCPEPQQRMIVALRQTNTSSHLLNLAQLIRNPGSDHPIHPLIVVEEGERVSRHMAQAERLLSDAVVHLSAADISAIPLTRIDLSVPAGILRAKREIRATDVIIGWSRRSSTLAFLFGTVQENLLTEPGYTLLVSRILEPLNTCKRVFLVIPPGTEMEPSFPNTVRRVRRLVRQLDAPLAVLTPTFRHKRVERRIKAVESGLAITFHPLQEWSLLIQTLNPLLQLSDLIIISSSQTGGAAGQRRYRSLPGKIAQRFPRNSLLVIHPEAPEEDIQSLSIATEETPSKAEPLHYELTNLTGAHLQEAILSVLSEYLTLPESPDRNRLQQKLIEDAIELMPGLVMMHAETSLVTTSSVIIGVNHSGLCWPDGTSGVHGLVLLIDPPGRDASRHLQNLSAVARIFHDPEIIEEIRSAQTIDDIHKSLYPRS